ncbi:MAG: hypothetical protein U9R01_01375 [candidate division WOR-3 bacterium]|nr:hypothetical protein [candidate division WOR-3 bacterium]
MKVIGQLKAILGLEKKGFEKGLDSAEKKTKSFGKQMAKLGGMLAAAFSVKKLLQWGEQLVTLFDKQIQAEKKLGAAIRANGGDVETILADYKQWASELQNISTVGDETTLKMLQVAQSMGVTGDNAKTAVKEAIALGKAMGMSEESAIRYTAALQDGNSTMLARYLPSLRSIDDEAGRTAKAHELLGNMFSQVTTEAQQGLGPAKQLSNAYGDMQEELGELIVNTDVYRDSIKIATARVKDATDALTAFNELMTSDYMQEQASWIERVSWQLAKHTKKGKENIKMMNEAVKRQKLLNKYEEAAAGSVERYQVMVKMLTMDLNKLEDQQSDEAKTLQNQIANYEKAIEIKKDDGKVTEEQIITLDSLNEQLKEQQDALENIDITNREAIADKVADIEATKQQIKAIEDYIDALKRAELQQEMLEKIEGRIDVDVGAEPIDIDTTQLVEGMKEQNFTLDQMKQKYLEVAGAMDYYTQAVIQANVMMATSMNEFITAAERYSEGLTLIEKSAMAMGMGMEDAAYQGVTSMKDLAKASIEAARKVIATYLAEAVAAQIKAWAGTGPWGLALAAGAAGATVAMFNSLVPSFATGGAVPGGYPNDTYPALLTSGERILTPQENKVYEKGGGMRVSFDNIRIGHDAIYISAKKGENKVRNSY